ncbi:hypothetical protein BpHYR1_042417 [Brachionus plicatilis]|uniref:Transmembrane protein n=1 Tax=Brachionus plicatilis TaxID=10195 RepID=A0A3M7RF14_BRAPC|nr:hypothetical protein BpHYR1_042417 [Brachionus plicatilis]
MPQFWHMDKRAVAKRLQWARATPRSHKKFPPPSSCSVSPSPLSIHCPNSGHFGSRFSGRMRSATFTGIALSLISFILGLFVNLNRKHFGVRVFLRALADHNLHFLFLVSHDLNKNNLSYYLFYLYSLKSTCIYKFQSVKFSNN